MADDDFIVPPPWLVPPAVESDSATHRLSPDRQRATPTRPEKPEIVFFPVVPGEPAPVIAADPEPEVEIPVDPPTAQPAAPPVEPPVEPALEPAAPELALEVELGLDPEADDATVMSLGRHAMTWRLVVPGLAAVPVFGILYLGRDPAVPAGESGAQALALTDPAKSVSKTHARLEVTAGQLYVSDLHSTNGVWVIPPGGEAIPVEPGGSTVVPAGSDIELGDFVIQVEHG